MSLFSTGAQESSQAANNPASGENNSPNRRISALPKRALIQQQQQASRAAGEEQRRRQQEEELEEQIQSERQVQASLQNSIEEIQQNYSSSQDQELDQGLHGLEFGNQTQTYIEEQDEESEYRFVINELHGQDTDNLCLAVDDLSTGSDSEYSNSKHHLVHAGHCHRC